SDSEIAEIADVFDLASFCQNPRRRSQISRSRVAPCSLQADAGNLRDDARAGRLGITKPKARKHWLEPCARRNAMRERDRRRDCSARVTGGACHLISFRR